MDRGFSQARPGKFKARYQRYEDLLKQASEKQTQTAQITIRWPSVSPDVVDFEGLSKASASAVLIDDLTFKLPPGGIVGVIGPTAPARPRCSGMNHQARRARTRALSSWVRACISAMSTSPATVSTARRAYGRKFPGGNEAHSARQARGQFARLFARRFNFKGADQQKKVGSLSGGERNRVHLAKMLKSGANVLLLDEPTNDLESIRCARWRRRWRNFAGCAVIISHDRWFLDRIASIILAFEGDSHVEMVRGQFPGL